MTAQKDAPYPPYKATSYLLVVPNGVPTPTG